MHDERERYEALRRKWPDYFANPPGAAYEILFDPAQVRTAEENYQARFPDYSARTGVVDQDPWRVIVRDAVRFPDGVLGAYARSLPARDGTGAAVLPVLDGRIVLLRIFRHATREVHLEIPRGFGENGVSAADQARNELGEEIQAKADTLIPLGRLHANTGAEAGATELFFVQISQHGDPQRQEGIRAVEMETPRRVAELIRDGVITDSFTTAAFTRSWLRGLLPGLPSV